MTTLDEGTAAGMMPTPCPCCSQRHPTSLGVDELAERFDGVESLVCAVSSQVTREHVDALARTSGMLAELVSIQRQILESHARLMPTLDRIANRV
jgi:hypothetical protein